MIEADAVVLSRYGGHGLRCYNCQFTAPKIIVVDSICLECNQKADFVDFIITQGFVS